MIKSIASSKTRRLIASASRSSVERTLQQQQRRLFAQGRVVATSTANNSNNNNNNSVVENDDWKNDRKRFLNTIGENDSLRDSTVYSLAMGSLEGSQFPPLLRNLNEREREQLRISRTQQRMMHTQQLYNTNKNSLTLTTNEWNDDLDDEDNFAGSMAYALSLASSDSFINNDEDVGSSVKFPSLTRSLNNREMDQLRISQDQLISMEGLSYRPASYPQLRQQKQQQHNNNSNMLPRTLREALRPSNEAIVITESSKPFNVFDVNGAWEGLCGYSYAESKGKSLGSLLRGEETETCTVTALIHQLFVHGEEATTVLTNYTKEGRKFHNRLRVGPIYDEDTGDVSHFVGVLKEVSFTA